MKRAVTLLIAITVFSPSRSASAACHAFNVAASPTTVAEGGAVNVTVRRDAGLAASSIRVSTIDETAKAGQDYIPVNRTISFSTADASDTFQIPTNNDTTTESAETFRIHLSDPGGCPLDTNFEIGPDARVTIQDNDAAQPSPKATSTSGGASPAASPSPPPPPTGETPAVTGPGVLAPSPTASPKVLAGPDGSDGPSGATLVAFVALGVSAAAGGGLWLLRKTPA